MIFISTWESHVTITNSSCFVSPFHLKTLETHLICYSWFLLVDCILLFPDAKIEYFLFRLFVLVLHSFAGALYFTWHLTHLLVFVCGVYYCRRNNSFRTWQGTPIAVVYVRSGKYLFCVFASEWVHTFCLVFRLEWSGRVVISSVFPLTLLRGFKFSTDFFQNFIFFVPEPLQPFPENPFLEEVLFRNLWLIHPEIYFR